MGNARMPLVPPRLFREIKGFTILITIGTVNRIVCKSYSRAACRAHCFPQSKAALGCAFHLADELLAPAPTLSGRLKLPRLFCSLLCVLP
jgi:hypothetical protein